MISSDDIVKEVYEHLGRPSGKSLRDLVKERQANLDISERQMCRVIGISKPSLRRILSGKAQKVDVLTLLKLSNFLQIDVQQSIKSFVAGMEADDIRDLEKTRKKNFIVNHFDLPALREVGFIESITDFDAITERITSFFEIDSVFEYNTDVAYALYSRTKRPSKNKMKEFWTRSAYCQFERRPNPNKFNKARLKELLPQISQYTRHVDKGLLTVARALFEAGITVIFQPYLAGTQVRGGTFVVDGKPCIVITDFNRDYATVWFALMHELGHVLYHLDRIKDINFHLSGDEDLFLIEDEANYFARELLFPTRKLDHVEGFIDNPHLIRRYAEKHKIHPTIIYSRFAYKQGTDATWARYQQHKVDPSKAVEAIRSHPWDKETITAGIDDALSHLAAEAND